MFIFLLFSGGRLHDERDVDVVVGGLVERRQRRLLRFPLPLFPQQGPDLVRGLAGLHGDVPGTHRDHPQPDSPHQHQGEGVAVKQHRHYRLGQPLFCQPGQLLYLCN